MDTRSVRISESARIPINYAPQPINFLSEDFIAGYQHNNRMSPVRRFFCLFVTFDLFFIGLLWLISVVINGENIYKAFEEQVVHYDIKKSLFDVVILAAIRFLVLIFFYAILHVDHWIVVALSTTVSCGFVIYKVFIYTWPATQEPVFQVLLIIISFILSWFEAWWLDRIIPQEMYSRTLAQALSSDARTPLLSSFLHNSNHGSFLAPPESYHNFYSPVDSVNNSDDDEDDEFKQLGINTVRKAYDLLESEGWKIEKVTSNNDTIQTKTTKSGKVYKLTGKVNHPPKKLLQELFYNIEEVPKWNPTLLESKIIKKIDSNTDVAYSISAAGGKGLVKSRDFVNLRCWKLINDSKMIENYDINSLSSIHENNSSQDGDNENSSDDEQAHNLKSIKIVNEKLLKKSASERALNENHAIENGNGVVNQLSKSLGATAIDINCASEDDEPYSDAQEVQNGIDPSKNVFVSAAMSIEYAPCPPTYKFIRGENLISCWVMRAVDGHPELSIFEWLLCIDLKGSLPKYVLNTAFVSLMQDYMLHLRTHIQTLNEKSKRSSVAEEC